jgi:cobalt-zinc-cadmium efflux system outer membrane protein
VRANEPRGSSLTVAELPTQISHIHVDDIARSLGREIVDVLPDLVARDDLPFAKREIFEQRELARRERDYSSGAPDDSRRAIELEITDLDQVGDRLISAPNEGPQTREQLVERERFDEVVISAEVEAVDPIMHLISRRDDEDADARASGTEPAKNRQAVELRYHEIEHQRIVRIRLGEPQSLFTVSGRVHGVTCLAEALRERTSKRLIVLDEQDAHRSRVLRIGGAVTPSLPTLISFSSKRARTCSVMRCRSLLMLGLAVTAPPALARASEERAVSLAEARSLAVRANPEVLLARQRETVARAQVDVAGALGNPFVTVETARLSARLTTGITVPVPLFGQRSTAIRAASSDVEATALETEAVRVDVRWNTTRAWLDLWEAQERAHMAETAAAEADRLAGIAEERFAAGSAPRLDVVRTGADRARARAEARAAGMSVAAAAVRLGVWLGATDPTVLRSRGAPDLGPLPPEEVVRERVLAQHPALARDRARVAAASAHVRAEERLRWPIVNFQLTVAQGDPTLPGTDVIGGLSFEAPLLSQRGGAIARARAEQALAETTSEVDLRRLNADLADGYAQASAAGLRARALGLEVLPALEETRRMTEEGYRDGRVDLLGVLDAQRAVLDGRAAYVEAQAGWQRALTDVERAMGAPLEEGAGLAP